MSDEHKTIEKLLEELQCAHKRIAELEEALSRLEQGQQNFSDVRQYFRRFLDTNIMGAAIATPNGGIIEANDSYLHMIGYTRKEFEEGLVNWLAITPPEWQSVDNHAIEQLRTMGVCLPYEKEYQRRDGSRIAVFLSDVLLQEEPEELIAAFILDISERKQTEEALRKSEAKFRFLHNSMRDAFVRTDLDGRFEEFNSAYVEMLGYQPEEFAKLSYIDITPEKWHAFEKDIIENQVIARGYSDLYEKEYRHKDGTIFPVELRVTLIRDEDGNPSGLWGLVRDITQRKRDEAALRSSENFRRRVFDSSPVPLVVMEAATWTYIDCNQAAVDIYRFATREDLLGKTPLDVSPPEQYDGIPSIRQAAFYIEKVIKEGSIIFEWRHQRPSGEIWDAEVNLMSFQDEQREYLQFTLQDISARKRMRAELQASEERYSLLFDNMLDAVFYCKMIYENGAPVDFVYLDANNAAKKIVGLEDIAGKRPTDFLPEIWESNPDPLEIYTRVLKTGLPEKFSQYVKQLEKWMDVSAYKFGEDSFVAIVSDITERKQAEDERERLQSQLLQSQKMESIGLLAGGIAHDFNNLLTAISGHTELGLLDKNLAPSVASHLHVIEKAAQSASELTRQLLAFSRKQIIEQKVIDLGELIKDMSKMLARLIGENIELRVSSQPDLFSIKVDPGQMHQIIMNICINSRDAMPDGGMLILETANVILDEEYYRHHSDALPGEYVMLAISDTGKGMDPETKQHLFEPFFTTKAKGKGTGLGLATVYGAVKQNGGTIEVYSEPGEGTSFKVYFPRIEGEAETLSKIPKDASIPGGSETILLVEDNTQVREFTRSVLERLGYHVLTAPCGEDALSTAGEFDGKIHLLMTDVIMPGINGRMLAEALTLERQDMKVLFCSGYTEDAIVHHGVLEQGLYFISKPYSVTRLAHKIREVLT